MINRQVWLDDTQPIESLSFEPIENRYVKVIIARIVLIYALLMACALFILLIEVDYADIILIVAECLLAVAFIVNVAMAKKIFRFRGYALRNKDISYRSGIFFPTVATVPYSKIQQVNVRMNPISRLFRLYYVDVINGSQNAMNEITIPGLSREKAEQMKSLLINNTACDND